MTTRTIPNIFPLVHPQELFTRTVLKGSLMRRLAQAQNYLWAKMVKVYGGHGYEGHGNYLFHLRHARVGAKDLDQVEGPDALGLALPVCSFIVPPNWAAGRVITVEGDYTLAAGTAGTQGTIIAAIYTLDDILISYTSQNCTDPTTHRWSLTLNAPQDQMYQCKVFMRLTDMNTGSEDDFADSFSCDFVSARYNVGTAAEIGGIAVPTVWAPTDDSHFVDDETYSSAILQRILFNTLHLYCYRAPELCQAWLGAPNCTTSTYTTVGKYMFYMPPRVTSLKGKLTVYCTSGGAGNEVRVKLNGSVVQTFSALGTGETLLDVTAFSVATGSNVITIEAKSTSASTGWGTVVQGVSIWESDTTLDVGSFAAVTDYQPQDEDALNGDDNIPMSINALGQVAGIVPLIRNDRWLAANRLRHVIGDWRHRTYKRTCRYNSAADGSPYGLVTGGNKIFQPGMDWTRGLAPIDYQLGRPKNITVRGDADADNDLDGFGLYPNGEASSVTAFDNALTMHTAAPDPTTPFPWFPVDFYFPLTDDYPHTGRRLAKHWIVNQTGKEIATAGGSWVCVIRGRRLRPALMTDDQVGNGPKTEEPDSSYHGPSVPGYWLHSSFVPVYDGTEITHIPIRGRGAVITEVEKHWGTPLLGTHDAVGPYSFQVRGRCPGATIARTEKVGQERDEGVLFEVELNSTYLADAPLTETILATL